MATMMLKISVLMLVIAAARVFCGQIVPLENHRYKFLRWSNLRGETVEVAAAYIHREYPEFTIRVRSTKYGINSDIFKNSVILYEDENGIVVNEPETVEEVPVEVIVWPELVGKEIEDAKKIILNDKPEAKIQTLLSPKFDSDDLEPNRVRIYVDSHDVVVEAPRSG